MQTGQHVANVGSRLKRVKVRKAPSEKPAFQPYRGKPAVRNDRGIEETSASFEARSAPRSYPTRELSSPRAAASGRVIHPGIDSAAQCGRLTVKALTPRWTLRAVTGR